MTDTGVETRFDWATQCRHRENRQDPISIDLRVHTDLDALCGADLFRMSPRAGEVCACFNWTVKKL